MKRPGPKAIVLFGGLDCGFRAVGPYPSERAASKAAGKRGHVLALEPVPAPEICPSCPRCARKLKVEEYPEQCPGKVTWCDCGYEEVTP